MKNVHLQASGLGKRYGSRVVFRDLGLEAPGGSATAIVGHNGSGKSTLVRILAGVLRPTRGTVTLTVNGISVSNDERPFCCGLAAPYLNVYEHFSARENLAFIARTRRLSGLGARVEQTLEAVGLATRADDLVKAFSSGMIQRMRLAAAVLTDPDVLLLDEPGSNLDEEGRQVVKSVIKRAKSMGRVVLVATNDPAEAKLCDERVDVTGTLEAETPRP